MEKSPPPSNPHPFPRRVEFKANTAMKTSKESGGAGGELNSPSKSSNLTDSLLRLLDQLSMLGETASQIKKAFEDGII